MRASPGTVIWKLAYRHAAARPGRSALTLFSIVIAVAAVSSVAIAISTTRIAYRDMFASVSGPAALEISSEIGGGFDEKALAAAEGAPGVALAVPLLQRPTILYASGRRVQLLAVGVDPAKYRRLRELTVQEGQPWDAGQGVYLEADFARRIGVQTQGQVRLLTRRGLRTVTVAGLVASRGSAAARLSGMMFMPLRQAQSLFAARGKVDSIQLVLDASAKAETVQQALAARLPPGVAVRPPATRTRLAEETLESSEQALSLASAFSLLLATFIILNTFLMNVGERRRHLAILRAIGATRRQVGRLLFAESVVLGCAGTLLGLLAGIAGAQGLTLVLDNILLASLPPAQLGVWPLAIASLCGLGVALLGAAVPAWHAARLSPREGMSGAAREEGERAPRRSLVAGSMVTLASGSLLAACILGWLPAQLAVSTAAVLLVGIVLLAVAAFPILSRIVAAVLSPLLRVEARLAHRQLRRHRLRSALTIGVLFLACATGVGLACAILDNVRDVRHWYQRAIVGDFFLRAMMPDMATGMAADMPEELDQEIRQIPGIENIDTFRLVRARAEGGPVIVVVREYTSDRHVHFDLKEGDAARLRDRLFQGQAVIGSVLAQRMGLHLGGTVALETLQGTQRLRIAGIANDYLVGGLTIYMERGLAKRLLGVEGVDGYVVRARPHALADVELRLQTLCTRHGVLLHSFADIRQMIDSMVAGVVGCLWGILALGFVAASFGVVNTLTMNVLEQTRELGLLRIIAMTRRQIRRTILAQAIILGILGVLPGVCAGLGLAYLIGLAAMPVLGRAVEFAFHPRLMGSSALGGLAIVLLSAMLPVERAARLNLAEALQYE